MRHRSLVSPPLSPSPSPGGELITILKATGGIVPQRRSGGALPRDLQLAELLTALAPDAGVIELNFRKSLEARAPASLKALAADLACYREFCAPLAGPGLPADESRAVRYIEYCEHRRLKPATIARRVSSLASAHALIGAPSPCSAPVVRDALRAMRRRNGTRQRQAGPLRLGGTTGRERPKTFTLAVLLEACGGSPTDLRNAALLSLGYDAGLRVSELIAVEVEHVVGQEDGSALLELPRSKTDQEGKGAFAWVSPETVRRVAAWREAAAINSGALFRRIVVTRTKPQAARPAIRLADLAPNALVDPEHMRAQPARQASATYIIGETALTAAAVRSIIKRVARNAADQGLVHLFGQELDAAIDKLSTHSLRVGLTQDLFASGADAGPIAQALRWSSVATALRYGGRLIPSQNAAARMLKRVRG